LQCRPQSFSKEIAPAAIPKDIPSRDMVFSANRYVSNGLIRDISHIVYVDPGGYNQLQRLEDLVNVGRAVGKLNMLLPKHHFVLMGPGRWGSRGDIRLGVQVNYADINNTAALIEVARQKLKYVPELSFGTHFFQDAVLISVVIGIANFVFKGNPVQGWLGNKQVAIFNQGLHITEEEG